MTYYLHQIRLWWWQMRLEGAELERDRASATELHRRCTGQRNRL